MFCADLRRSSRSDSTEKNAACGVRITPRVPEEPRACRHGLHRQHVEAEPREHAGVERGERSVHVDDGAARGVDEERARASPRAAPRRPIMPRVSALSGTCSETTSLSPNSSARLRRSTKAGKSPSMMYGIAGDDALEHVAADVRHPLADAPEADDAERHVADAAQGPGRQVMPLPRVDVAMVGDDVARSSARASASACVATSPTP